MQTRDMWKSSKWKLVAGAATLSALGISGIALADQSTSPAQEAIHLRDKVSSADANVSVPDLNIRPMGGWFGDDLDSPFDDTNTNDSLTDDSVGSVSGDSPAGLDSLSGDTASGLNAGSDDSVNSDDVISPATPAPAPAPAAPPIADDSFDSASASFGSVDSANGT